MKLQKLIPPLVFATASFVAFQNCSPTRFGAPDGQRVEVPSTSGDETKDPILAAPISSKLFAPKGFSFGTWNPNWSSEPPGFVSSVNRVSPGNGISPIYKHKLFVTSNDWIGVTSSCGLFLSRNGGATFETINTQGLSGDILAIESDGVRLYVGTTFGLFISTDLGMTFRHALTPTTPFPVSVNCSQVSPGTSFSIRKISVQGTTVILSTDAGIMVSSDGGTNFVFPKVVHEGFVLPNITEVTSIRQNGSSVSIGLRPFFSLTGVNVRPSSGGGQCAVRSSWTNSDYAVITSTDGGLSFNTIPVSSVHALYHNGNKMVAHVNENAYSSTYLNSDNGGLTWNQSNMVALPRSSAGPNIMPASVAFETGLAYSNSKLWGVYSSFDERDRLVYSLDEGKNFSTINLDPSITDRFVITSVKAAGPTLAVATNRGLYISKDGANFSRKQFSSPYCSYPWWNQYGFIGSSGQKRFFIERSNWRKMIVSNDAGATLAAANQPLDFLSNFGGISFPQIEQADSQLVFANYLDQVVFFDLLTGSSSAGSLSQTVRLSGTNVEASLVDGLRQHRPIYLNQSVLRPLSALNTQQIAALMGAASNEQMMVLGIRSGIAPLPGVWTDGGFAVYKNGSLVQTVNDIGPTRKVVRMIEGKIFAFGDRLWSLDPVNGQMRIAPGSPRMPENLFSYEGVIYATTTQEVYSSTDGGVTFSVWNGELK